MFYEQLGLFTYAAGLPVRPELQNRDLTDVSLDVLALSISSDLDNSGLVKLLISFNSSICQAEDQPWNSARTFGRITVSVYDLKGEHKDNGREAYDVDSELMDMEENNSGHKLFGKGVIYGRYGFIVSVYVGDAEDGLLI